MQMKNTRIIEVLSTETLKEDLEKRYTESKTKLTEARQNADKIVEKMEKNVKEAKEIKLLTKEDIEYLTLLNYDFDADGKPIYINKLKETQEDLEKKVSELTEKPTRKSIDAVKIAAIAFKNAASQDISPLYENEMVMGNKTRYENILKKMKTYQEKMKKDYDNKRLIDDFKLEDVTSEDMSWMENKTDKTHPEFDAIEKAIVDLKTVNPSVANADRYDEEAKKLVLKKYDGLFPDSIVIDFEKNCSALISKVKTKTKEYLDNKIGHDGEIPTLNDNPYQVDDFTVEGATCKFTEKEFTKLWKSVLENMQTTLSFELVTDKQKLTEKLINGLPDPETSFKKRVIEVVDPFGSGKVIGPFFSDGENGIIASFLIGNANLINSVTNYKVLNQNTPLEEALKAKFTEKNYLPEDGLYELLSKDDSSSKSTIKIENINFGLRSALKVDDTGKQQFAIDNSEVAVNATLENIKREKIIDVFKTQREKLTDKLAADYNDDDSDLIKDVIDNNPISPDAAAYINLFCNLDQKKTDFQKYGSDQLKSLPVYNYNLNLKTAADDALNQIVDKNVNDQVDEISKQKKGTTTRIEGYRQDEEPKFVPVDLYNKNKTLKWETDVLNKKLKALNQKYKEMEASWRWNRTEWQIAFVCVGGLLFIALIGSLVYVCKKRKEDADNMQAKDVTISAGLV
jgi:hypothetical protein